MLGNHHNPLAAYARNSIDANVNSATPRQLIILLFEGAENAIGVAKIHMERGETAQKGILVSRAIDIINNGLMASLDLKSGGPLAEQLVALYHYMARRLLRANIENNPAALDEVTRLLKEIHSAWVEMPTQE